MSDLSIQPLYTILGAGGIIADGLATTLVAHQKQVRLVSRSPKSIGGITDLVKADITDYEQT